MMVLSVRRRIAGIARAEPDRTALVGGATEGAGKIQRWRLAPRPQNGAALP